MKKLLVTILSAVLLMGTFVGCDKDVDVSGKVKAKITVEDFGEITLELDADTAPITVQNFVDLANDGFYDGLTFHRVVKDFMIQGGDPKGDGSGGSPNKIKGEFEANGVENKISHKRGVISMARSSNSYDSASSQFFICHIDYPSLDGQYAAFGKVIEGMDVVDKIAEIEVTMGSDGLMSKPVKKPVIKTIEIID